MPTISISIPCCSIFFLILFVSAYCSLNICTDTNAMRGTSEEYLVHERKVIIPLGASTSFKCFSSYEINMLSESHNTSWIYMANANCYDVDERTNQRWFVRNNVIHLKNAERSDDGSKVKCISVNEKEKVVVVSSVQIEVADCHDDRTNLCVYGTCVHNHTLQCVCHEHYTGIFCDEPKTYYYIMVLTPYLGEILMIIIAIFVMALQRHKDRKEKTMNIVQNLPIYDRMDVKHHNLYRLPAALDLSRMMELDDMAEQKTQSQKSAKEKTKVMPVVTAFMAVEDSKISKQDKPEKTKSRDFGILKIGEHSSVTTTVTKPIN